MIFFLCYLMIILLIFLSVAFVTLFERKFLGVLGLRFGPSFVFYYGLFQPLYDFLKLLFKRFELFYFLDFWFWVISPVWGVLLFLLILLFFPLSGSFFFWVYGLLMVFLSFSLLVYMFFFGGWVGTGVFSLISSLRVVVQMISYEVGFMFMMMYFFMFYYVFDFFDVSGFSLGGVFFFVFLWIVICAAEMGRSPFDFLEGESELVSGFNLEFLGLGFSLIFLVEYGFMVVSSLITSLMLFGSELYFSVFVVVFILIRGSFPRYRYDYMLLFFWKDLFYLLLGLYLLINFLLGL